MKDAGRDPVIRFGLLKDGKLLSIPNSAHETRNRHYVTFVVHDDHRAVLAWGDVPATAIDNPIGNSECVSKMARQEVSILDSVSAAHSTDNMSASSPRRSQPSGARSSVGRCSITNCL
jgi:hypothetical protein